MLASALDTDQRARSPGAPPPTLTPGRAPAPAPSPSPGPSPCLAPAPRPNPRPKFRPNPRPNSRPKSRPTSRPSSKQICIGLTPFVDNFMHMGGLLAGLVIGGMLFSKKHPDAHGVLRYDR